MDLNHLFEEAKQRVREKPSDIQARSALWQVMAARGEFDRAAKQLDAMVSLDSSWAMEAVSCQALLRAEMNRQEVLLGRIPPVCLGSSPAWFADMCLGLELLQSPPRISQALELLTRAQQANDTRSGTLNGQPFTWLCDGDVRFGPCLELIVQGRYFFVPWSRITRLQSRPPTEIRDRLWLHCYVEFGDEGSIEAFLPACYSGSSSDMHRLGQITEWTEVGAGSFIGIGQKVLMTDIGDFGLLDIRELTFA